jgi:outer membrane protein assembly factor BamB
LWRYATGKVSASNLAVAGDITGGGGGTDLRPAIDDGVIYAASRTNDRLYALESTTGTVRWQFRLGHDVYGVASIAAHAGMVYLAGSGRSDGLLLAVEAP